MEIGFNQVIKFGRFKDRRVVCPCDTEESEIYKWLIRHKDELQYKEVVLSDLSKCSCLDFPYQKEDLVLTNPPFSIGTKFLRVLQSVGCDFYIFIPQLSAVRMVQSHISAFQLKDTIFRRPAGYEAHNSINCYIANTFPEDTWEINLPDVPSKHPKDWSGKLVNELWFYKGPKNNFTDREPEDRWLPYFQSWAETAYVDLDSLEEFVIPCTAFWRVDLKKFKLMRTYCTVDGKDKFVALYERRK